MAMFKTKTLYSMTQTATFPARAAYRVHRTRKTLSINAVVQALVMLGLLFAGIGSMQAQQAQQATQAQQAADAKQVPVVDGGAGSCSVEFTVTDGKGHPIYAANIKVHVAYGFMGSHRLDLQVGTNFDGKARFTGLPLKVKGGTLYFQASQGKKIGSAFYDPTQNCTATEGLFISEK